MFELPLFIIRDKSNKIKIMIFSTAVLKVKRSNKPDFVFHIKISISFSEIPEEFLIAT